MTAWLAPRGTPKPEGGEVHLWRIGLEGPPEPEPVLDALDDEERERAGRFRRREDRDRFVHCRAALRVVLGGCLDQQPDRVALAVGPHGKPKLAEPNSRNLQFNLSHSERWGLLAVASGLRLGVDIERVNPDRVDDRLAERFFSALEVAALRETPAWDRSEAFFRCWTRKEAYVKARGEGLSMPLRSFSVSIDSATRPRLMNAGHGDAELAGWELRDLQPAPGYAGALAVEGTGWSLRCWRFPPSLLRPA